MWTYYCLGLLQKSGKVCGVTIKKVSFGMLPTLQFRYVTCLRYSFGIPPAYVTLRNAAYVIAS
jgi:hypothetical protein